MLRRYGYGRLGTAMLWRLWDRTYRTHEPAPVRQFRSALLMLDGDAAGQSAIEAIAQRLGPVGYESRCHLRPGVQLDQLAPRGINDMLSPPVRAHATRGS